MLDRLQQLSVITVTSRP